MTSPDRGGNWHNQLSPSHREQEVQEIARFLTELDPVATASSKLMLAKRFEDLVFRSASSLEEYRQLIASRLMKLKKNSKSFIRRGATVCDGNDTETMICFICCEDKELVNFSECSHTGCCRACAEQWIQKEEAAGRTAPTCPYCRMDLPEKDIKDVLGRSYQPKKGLPVDGSEMGDDLTRQVLQEQTVPCPLCGVRIMKTGGCDLMECLCGFRFCYACGSPGAQCVHTSRRHFYWDNVLNQNAPRQAPQPAIVDQETGQIDLAAYRLSRIRFSSQFQSSDQQAARLPTAPIRPPTNTNSTNRQRVISVDWQSDQDREDRQRMIMKM